MATKKKSDKKEVKKVILSDRNKFHNWYHKEYLKGASEMIAKKELHHCDKHGMIGYKNNAFDHETQTVTGKIEHVALKGLCQFCSLEFPSAKQEYEKNGDNS